MITSRHNNFVVHARRFHAHNRKNGMGAVAATATIRFLETTTNCDDNYGSDVGGGGIERVHNKLYPTNRKRRPLPLSLSSSSSSSTSSRYHDDYNGTPFSSSPSRMTHRPFSTSTSTTTTTTNSNNQNKDDDKSIPQTLETVARWIQKRLESSSKKKNDPDIMVLFGAGVSVAAGLPDFRSPGTGLYDNLQTYDLPFPEAVFDLEYYQHRPSAFLMLAQEIWPGRTSSSSGGGNNAISAPPSMKETHRTTTTTTTTTIPPSPTLTHSFLALLEQRGLLRRCYTQNIDGLEVLGGVSADKMVECHGHFRTASCITCGTPADIDVFHESVLNGATEPPLCTNCRGYIKPDIVFFGEALPARVFQLLHADLDAAKLLLIMGTSLHVQPVASIPDKVSPSCRRVLLNRELVGNLDLDGRTRHDRRKSILKDVILTMAPLVGKSTDDDDNEEEEEDDAPRDLFHPGDCDDSVQEICRFLGWEEDLVKQNQSTRLDGQGSRKQ